MWTARRLSQEVKFIEKPFVGANSLVNFGRLCLRLLRGKQNQRLFILDTAKKEDCVSAHVMFNYNLLFSYLLAAMQRATEKKFGTNGRLRTYDPDALPDVLNEPLGRWIVNVASQTMCP